MVARGPGSARFEQERWSSEAREGCSLPRSASYAPAMARAVWSREFDHGVVVGCSLGGIRVRREHASGITRRYSFTGLDRVDLYRKVAPASDLKALHRAAHYRSLRPRPIFME